jgi:hypothetical protein
VPGGDGASHAESVARFGADSMTAAGVDQSRPRCDASVRALGSTRCYGGAPRRACARLR